MPVARLTPASNDERKVKPFKQAQLDEGTKPGVLKVDTMGWLVEGLKDKDSVFSEARMIAYHYRHYEEFETCRYISE